MTVSASMTSMHQNIEIPKAREMPGKAAGLKPVIVPIGGKQQHYKRCLRLFRQDFQPLNQVRTVSRRRSGHVNSGV